MHKKIVGICCISFLLCGSSVVFVRDILQDDYERQYAEQLQQQQTSIQEITDMMQQTDKLIDKKTIKLPVEGDAYATIRVDRVHFSKPLYYGDSDELLKKGIGHYMGSALPGEGKPILLAGHNGTEFYQLRNMKKGDMVKIKTSYGSYTYQITTMEIKDASEFHAAQLQENKEYLIMYCCYPFDSLDTQQRYFVYADYVNGPRFKGA